MAGVAAMGLRPAMVGLWQILGRSPRMTEPGFTSRSSPGRCRQAGIAIEHGPAISRAAFLRPRSVRQAGECSRTCLIARHRPPDDDDFRYPRCDGGYTVLPV